jgi:hypothetical protein
MIVNIREPKLYTLAKRIAETFPRFWFTVMAQEEAKTEFIYEYKELLESNADLITLSEQALNAMRRRRRYWPLKLRCKTGRLS